jgi:hypothetical protein
MKYLVRSTIVSMSTAHTHFDIDKPIGGCAQSGAGIRMVVRMGGTVCSALRVEATMSTLRKPSYRRLS